MRALLLAFACLGLLAVACGGKEPSPASSGAGSSAGPAAGDLGPDAAQNGAGFSTSTAQTLPDRLVVSTRIELEARDLRRTYLEVSARARELGGFVAEGALSDEEDGGSAFVRIRVPAPRHDEMVALVRGLTDVEVRREESSAMEVTEEYTDLRSRAANLRVAEAQYQQLLDRAGSIEEVLKVTARLDDVRGDIEQIEGRIRLIEDQSDFATIAVSMTLPTAAVAQAGLPSPLSVLVEAMETSLTVAHALLNLAIVLFVAGLWLIPASAVAVVLWRRLRRPLLALKTWLE